MFLPFRSRCLQIQLDTGDPDLPAIPNFAPARFFNIQRTFDSTSIAETDLDPGDVNFDGFVDIFDINLVSSNWSGTTRRPTAT